MERGGEERGERGKGAAVAASSEVGDKAAGRLPLAGAAGLGWPLGHQAEQAKRERKKKEKE